MGRQAVDLQLKFDGIPVHQLDGAPVEAVVASLTALQRMIHIIGMRVEGHALGQRLKPSIKVRREYTVVCRAPEKGSHIQPFAVASRTGATTLAASRAQDRLLTTLKAFNSGDEKRLRLAVPNPRDRWFLANAATGLLPEESSGLEVMIRAGTRGPFAFKANQARPLIAKYNTPKPPTPDEETIAGKLQAIDFQRTIMTVKPGSEPALRMDYPLPLEVWLQTNVRKRLKISGKPTINQRGDISSFSDIQNVVELEPHLEPISGFMVDQLRASTSRPLTLPITVYWADRLFGFIDERLGIDVVVDDLADLRDAVISELVFVWRQYAQADDRELDEQARQVKKSLLSRFVQQANG